MVVAASISTWLFAAEHPGEIPAHATAPPLLEHDIEVSAAVRDDAFRRAAVKLDAGAGLGARSVDPTPITCRFIRDEPSGTSAKFSCALEDGQVIKVKYGRNPEIQAEAAGTRLLRALGYAADAVTVVPRVRCYGCPRFPFVTMQILSLARASSMLGANGHDRGYTDFEWPAVERKFPAPAIETDTVEGWAWWELKTSQAPRADLDAFRLLAVFLAHWDNKSSNQRLVCLEGETPCARPLLMIQDLGATFGPTKVNLERWRDTRIWGDRATCTASMHQLPYMGASFTDVRISEEGRRQLAQQLAALSEADIRSLFADARFPEFYSSTDDTRDLDVWTAAFRARVDQIVSGPPCPTSSSRESLPSRPSPDSSS